LSDSRNKHSIVKNTRAREPMFDVGRSVLHPHTIHIN